MSLSEAFYVLKEAILDNAIIIAFVLSIGFLIILLISTFNPAAVYAVQGYDFIEKEVAFPYQSSAANTIYDSDGTRYVIGNEFISARYALGGIDFYQTYNITYACKPNEHRAIVDMKQITFPVEPVPTPDPYKCVTNATTGVCE